MDKDPITDQNIQHKYTITKALNRNNFDSKNLIKYWTKETLGTSLRLRLRTLQKDTVGLYYKSF